MIARFNDLIRKDLLLRRVLGNSGWLLGSNVLNALLQVAQGILIARFLGVTLFGVFSLITIFNNVVTQAFDSRVWATAIKFVSKFQASGEHNRATAVLKLCYMIDTLAAIIGATIIVLFADFASTYLIKDNSLQPWIQVFSLSLLFSIPVATSTAVLRLANKFDWLAYSQSAVLFIRLAALSITLPLGYSVPGALLSVLAATAVNAIGLALLARIVWNNLNLVPMEEAPLRLLKGDFKAIAGFLGATNGQSTLKLLQTYVPVLIMGYWLTPAAVGLYQFAHKLVGIINFPVGPIASAAYPEFTRLWHRGEIDQLRRIVKRITVLLSSAALVGLITLVCFGHQIIMLSGGNEFIEAEPVMLWLGVGMAIAVAANCVGPLLMAIGRSFAYLSAMVVGFLCQCVAFFVLVPQLGPKGAAISVTIFYIVWVAIASIWLRNVLSKRSAVAVPAPPQSLRSVA